MNPEWKKRITFAVVEAIIAGAIGLGFGWYARGMDPMTEQMRMCSAVTDCMSAHPTKVDMTLSCGNALYKLKAAHDKAKQKEAP
ncbi:MAG: hypothetical protein NTX72_04005 [Candidatus Uhrbacteria bacterium]|nr:hypothetical protein [Candidatus Uhrbacteria bacterium]